MTVDAFASERHYLDHVAAVWRQIPPAERGTLYAGVPRGAHARAVALGLDHQPCRVPRQDGTPILVASYGDERACLGGRPVALLEHGAGQHYGGPRSSTDDGAFAGGPGREAVGLFLCPNPEVADRNSTTYPNATTVVVGSPRLAPYLRRLPCFCVGATPDEAIADVVAPWEVAETCDWHGAESNYSRLGRPPSRPVVAVSFHWDCQTWEESRSTISYYRKAIPAVRSRFPGTVGHAHPRIWADASRLFLASDVQVRPHFDDVLDYADVYVTDNSSTLYEYAALDRPVVVLNAPWYRRSVEHGLRFWEYADVGLQVDDPADLVSTIEAALDDPPAQAARRREIVDRIFPTPPDGPRREAADRFAAVALLAWAETVTG